ncbi:hypothetical protein [Sediminibacillus massiliensis]|uniref:hypothetical protein n=1 Tax=Sediminibacillus massiliensis TaxID=1926277 RepID=UPI0009888D9D|nr:hypothetical protein [Sediminibacillus massiliensis]
MELNPFRSINLHSSLHKTLNQRPMVTLQPGQILSGRIQKLYPDQKASIQLGSSIMTAQLEAPLTIHKNYWFQVQSVGNLVRLKVLSDHGGTSAGRGIKQLLQELGIPVTKSRISFVKNLLEHNIPFGKDNLYKALLTMEQATDKGLAREVLVNAMQRNLPLTTAVYDALTATKQEQLGKLLSELHLSLKTQHTASLPGLLQILEQLTLQGGKSLENRLQSQILQEVASKNTSMFRLLRLTGFVSSTTDYASWQDAWLNWRNSAEPSSPPFSIKGKESSLINSLDKLLKQQMSLQENERKITWNYIQNIRNMKKGNGTPNVSIKASLLHQQLSDRGVLTKLIRHLPDISESFLKYGPTKSISDQELLQVERTMEKQLTVSEKKAIFDLMTGTKEGQEFFKEKPAAIFLSKLFHFQSLLGIGYENQLKQQKYSENTLKSILFQFVQSGNISTEQSETLLNFITGLQLNSIQENSESIHLNYQLPGDHIGINKDIRVEFEGRKGKNGEIDSDYCSILFYLELDKLKETVVNMNVESRRVNLTIYNKQERGLEQLLSTYKSILKEKLNELDYQLTSISLKPLEDQTKFDYLQEKNINYEGVDFKI